MNNKQTKYCPGCGARLRPEIDLAYWKFNKRCLKCRLISLFARHGLKYKAA